MKENVNRKEKSDTCSIKETVQRQLRQTLGDFPAWYATDDTCRFGGGEIECVPPGGKG